MTQSTTSRSRSARRNGGPRVPGPEASDLRERLNVKWKLAELLVDSGYLPEGVDRPEQALFVMLKGEELGLPPVQALTSINVIDGSPTLSGALLMALCIRDADCRFEVERREADGAAVTIHRPEWPPYTAEFTEEDAERAGLTEDEYWERYPKAMYFWRAVAEACRTVCPDVVAGLYTPEELGQPEPESGAAGGEIPVGTQNGRPGGEGDGLRDRYRELWAALVPDEEERNEIRRRFEDEHPRLPGDREEWGRTEYVVAVRTVEEAGAGIVRDYAESGEVS